MAKGKRHETATVKDHVVKAGSPTDIVIAIMGPTSARKSTFINTVLGAERMVVGHKLTSCTAQLEYAVIELPGYPTLQGRRVVMVDTPGFDDTYEDDVEILRRISVWLENSYRKKEVLGGIIYLHDISHDRFSGTARMNLEIFNHLCGDAALSKVILGTTKWRRVTEDVGKRREEELRDVHWKPMIDKGSKMQRFDGTPDSAREFINVVLGCRIVIETPLEIQKELAVDKKIVSKTKAGKDLEKRMQSQRELKTSLGRRFLRFIGIK